MINKFSHIIAALIFGIFGALAQEPYRSWPLGILFIGYLFYCWQQYITYKRKDYVLYFVICWVTYANIVCNWLSYFSSFATIAFIMLQGIFAFIFIYLGSKFSIKSVPTIYFAISFCTFEFILGHIPTLSFTWLNISTIPINISYLHNFIRAGGGALLTFIFVLISAKFSELVFSKRKIFSFNLKVLTKNQNIINVVLISFLLITFFLGNNVLDDTKPNYKITIVQGNDINRYLTKDEIDNDYLRNSHIDLAKNIDTNPDLIVFPESAFNVDPFDKSNRLVQDLKPIAKKAKSLMIINSNTYQGANYYNTNIFYNSNMKYIGKYSKKRLVPFGEYVPLKNVIGKWSVFKNIGEGFSPGKKDLTLKGITSLICFESTFTDDFYRAITKLMVITTNNRSYRLSGNSKQHLAQSKLRAIEFSIPVIHASVSGKSAIIGKDGELIAQSEMFKNKLIEGSVNTSISRSFFSQYHDWFSFLCLIVVLWSVVLKAKESKWKKRI